jgi:hypothetical protein
MEVRDGFIVGIFNYCDRWCETCAFTSHCRLFADAAEIEAKLDPGLKEIVEAPPLPQDVPPPPPPWIQEMIDEMNEASNGGVATADLPPPRPVPAEHLLIEARADDYFSRAHAWLRGRTYPVGDAGDPCAVVGWFHLQIVVKVHRAIRGLADDDPDERDWPADHDGSAKVALLGIDRSHAAWLEAVERGMASNSEAAPFIADLVWLGEALERVFPKARAFVRPAFDEPEEVSALLAVESRRR